MYKRFLLSLLLAVFLVYANAQPPQGIRWSAEGDSYFDKNETGLVKVHLPDMVKTTIAASSALIPAGQNTPLFVRNFFLSPD